MFSKNESVQDLKVRSWKIVDLQHRTHSTTAVNDKIPAEICRFFAPHIFGTIDASAR